MYITYNEKDYPCKCRIGQSVTYSGLPEDFPSPVSGEIILKANDGFVLRTDVAENYLRQTFEDGSLTLTNAPEPKPEDEENVETGKPIEITLQEEHAEILKQLAETDEAAIELYEANLLLEIANAEQDEAIIEIYEMIGDSTNG